MVKYTFHYFNLRGLGEPTRLLFAYTGVDYEDHRIEPANFKKDQWPFGKLPVLDVDGKKLPESFAILRYLAKQNGLAGKNDFESAEIDSIAYLFKDFMLGYMPYIMVLAGRKPGDKDEMRKEHFLPAMEQYLPIVERLLKESGSGYLHKSGVSWVDFFAATLTYNGCKLLPEDFNKSKLLVEHCERVHSLPKVKEYVAKRPDTPF